MDNEENLRILNWQKELCESGNAGYRKGQMVDMRGVIHGEPFNEKAIENILKNINKKLKN